MECFNMEYLILIVTLKRRQVVKKFHGQCTPFLPSFVSTSAEKSVAYIIFAYLQKKIRT